LVGQTRGVDVGVAAAARHLDVPLRSAVVVAVVQDASAPCGSAVRHSHVRGSEPQCVHAQVVAPYCARRWPSGDGGAENDSGIGSCGGGGRRVLRSGAR